MSNILKYAAYGLGGTTLIAGSFFLVAALSGTPLSELKAVGGLFPEKPAVQVSDDDQDTELEVQLQNDTRSPQQLYDSAKNPLTAFTMPTPFSSQELGDLEDRLTLRMDQLEERAKSLDVRENLLNQEAEHLERLRKDLERMKTDLIREADEQKAEQEELAATAAAQAARDKTVFKKLAAQFLDGEPDVTVEQILNVYDNPHDAAKLFMEMPTERVNELFGALYLLNKEKHKAYFNAFQLAQAR